MPVAALPHRKLVSAERVPPVRPGVWNLFLVFMELVHFDTLATCKGFSGVHRWIRGLKITVPYAPPSVVIEHVKVAVDAACLWYPKTAMCLQRSAALVSVLRKHGVAAELVIGIQQFPFRSHAWAECDGVVLNDNQKVTTLYRVIDRC